MKIQIVAVSEKGFARLAAVNKTEQTGVAKHVVKPGEKITVLADEVALTGAETVKQQKLKLVKVGKDLIIQNQDGTETLAELEDFFQEPGSQLYGDEWAYAKDSQLEQIGSGVTHTASPVTADALLSAAALQPTNWLGYAFTTAWTGGVLYNLKNYKSDDAAGSGTSGGNGQGQNNGNNGSNENGNPVSKISAAAQNNTASNSTPTLSDYSAEGVTGVTASNLEAINSALNSASINGAATDTSTEIQTLVDAYNFILTAADGNADNDAHPTQAQYAAIGVTGVDSAVKSSLLGSVVDAKNTADVDTVAELQALADAAALVMSGAAGGAAPTLEQLQSLGLTGLTAANLTTVQAIIAATSDDGTGVDTLSELQTLIDAANNALNTISAAAENNTATGTTPSLSAYGAVAVTGVTANNLAAISSALNSASVNGAAADTTAEIQAVVDGYQAILSAADGTDDNDANPTQAHYAAMGVTGVDSAVKTSLLGDVVDKTNTADIDTVTEVQALADAVSSVMSGAAGGAGPTLAQLQSLGLTGVTATNLASVQAVIAGTANDGTGVDTLAEIQALIDAALNAQDALDTISAAAENNTATNTTPALSDYSAAVVSGVTAANLGAINSALNSASVNGAAADTIGEIQTIVDGYQAILTAADGTDDNDASPTQAQYAAIGVTGVDSAVKTSLLGDVVDVKNTADIDTVIEVQDLADAAAAVMSGAAGGAGPTLAQLELLGLSGVTAGNLTTVLNVIAGTGDDGTGVDTMSELQTLINAISTAINAISAAAQNNAATATSPALSVYGAAGVTGMTDNNLAAINSALNSDSVNGAATDTTAEIQTVVDSYSAILTVADGTDDNDPSPTQAQYAAIGVTGVDSAVKTSLLGDVVDIKNAVDVDTVTEVQGLANAVAAVMSGAQGGSAPTLAQLQSLGLTGVTTGNLATVQAAIAGTVDSGTAVDTLSELQGLINAANSAINAISTAAENNTATSTSPALSVYAAAGVTGMTASNLAAINSALNSAAVNGAATDTTSKIQTLVDAYRAILLAADGNDDNDAKPTQAQYTAIGVTGIDSAVKISLLGDVVDIKSTANVDTVTEVQALADAAIAVMSGAAGNTAPTLSQLQLLGLTGVTASNLAAVQNAIANTANDGTAVDTLLELQNLITTTNNQIADAINTISMAAENNTANDTTPALTDYALASVTGVTADNLTSISSALNSLTVDGLATDSTSEIQTVVDAYNTILAVADGEDDNDTLPTQLEYAAIGVEGVDNTVNEKLLGDVLDIKNADAVDTVPELQALANAVTAVMNAAAGDTTGPSLAQLQSLSLTGMSAGTLSAVQTAIKATADDGTEVDSLAELQALIDGINGAINVISAAAQGNTATATSPALSDYTTAGVSFVTAGNLAAINTALNTAVVNGAATDTTTEIQAMVDAYRNILSAADGLDDNDAKPAQTDYSLIGVTGVNNAVKVSLMGDVVDIKAFAAVDTVSEVQSLAAAVNAVMTGASGGAAPSLTQLQLLGLTGLSTANLSGVQAAIAASADTGAEVDTLTELQAMVNNQPPALVSTTPTDNTTGVNVTDNLTLNFTEAISAGSGSILLKDLTHGTTLSINITDPNQVNISGSTLTINPTSTLVWGSNYAIQMPAGIVKDSSGNNFAGISDDTTLNFTTVTATAGDATISMGNFGSLIAPVQMEGKWYYSWDINGDGVMSTAQTSIGNDQQSFNWLQNTFFGGNTMTDSNRTFTYHGVTMRIPTMGQSPITAATLKNGTAWSNATPGWDTVAGSNVAYDDFVALWDAFNGTATTTTSLGVPTNWAAEYLTATQSSNGHYVWSFNGGYSSNLQNTYAYYIAVEVV